MTRVRTLSAGQHNPRGIPGAKSSAVLAGVIVTVVAVVAVPAALSRTPSLGDAASKQPPPPLRAEPAVFPIPEVRTLPNGLKVMVIERRSLPLLTVRLVVKAGAEADPGNRPGTAQLVAALLPEGTARRTQRGIAEAVDSAGGTLEARADWDSSFASIGVLSDQAELAFDILSDIVLHPAFLPAEVERQRRQTLSALEVASGDAGHLADTVFRRLAFAGTPYGHPEDGTPESIRRIAPEQLRDFHREYYYPKNSILGIAGDISTPAALKLAEKWFGAWPPGERSSRRQSKEYSEPAAQPVRPVASGPFVIVDKPDAVETEIRVGTLAIPRASPHYDALAVANQILGGPGGNRLFQTLRTERALTYSASSELLCYRDAGEWIGKSVTRTSETAQSLQAMLGEMRRLHDHLVARQELETAQGYLAGHTALEVESASGLLTRFQELFAEDLPPESWSRLLQNIASVSARDVLAVTRRFLDTKHNVIVLVGNAAAFRDDLRSVGPFQVIPVRSLDGPR